jgi:hypothetical protein
LDEDVVVSEALSLIEAKAKDATLSDGDGPIDHDRLKTCIETIKSSCEEHEKEFVDQTESKENIQLISE